jgi:hypothetical protein
LLYFLLIKTGVKRALLSSMFHVTEPMLSLLFYRYTIILSDFLRWEFAAPSQDQVKRAAPKRFDRIPGLRFIIDTTKVHFQRPSNPRVNSTLFSKYYHGFVAKFLIGIAPSGAYTYVSDGFPGKITDKVIVSASGLLAGVEKGDVVMADKGFPITIVLNAKGAKLVIPTIRAKGQKVYGVDEQKFSEMVANLRIDIECAIGRIQNFSILTRRWSLLQLDLISKVFAVCTLLCNYGIPFRKPVPGAFADKDTPTEWTGQCLAQLQWPHGPAIEVEWIADADAAVQKQEDAAKRVQQEEMMQAAGLGNLSLDGVDDFKMEDGQ